MIESAPEASAKPLRVVSSGEPADWYQAFLRLPEQVYARDPLYCPSHGDDLRHKIEHPRFAGRQTLWLVLAGDRPIARCVTRRSPDLEAATGLSIGTIGFFEVVIDDVEVARSATRELLSAATDHLRREGVDKIYGPMDGDTWQRYRFALGPYDTPPFLIEPYQPAIYPKLWEENGFVPARHYASYRVDNLAAALAELEPCYQRCREAGYEFDRLYRARYEDDLHRIHRLSSHVLHDDFLHSELAWDDFSKQYLPLKALVDPELIFFARYGEEEVGYLFAMPDLYPALQAMGGKFGFFAKIRFLMASRKVDVVNIRSIGVLPAHQHSGLGRALLYLAYRNAMARRYEHVNLCLIEEGHPVRHLDTGSVSNDQRSELRRYVLYQAAQESDS